MAKVADKYLKVDPWAIIEEGYCGDHLFKPSIPKLWQSYGFRIRWKLKCTIANTGLILWVLSCLYPQSGWDKAVIK
jgi:hypothetical protein